MTGYQQAIMYLSGSYTGDRFCVRNIDRHYVDAVRDCFPDDVSVFLQHRAEADKKDYWCIKSAQVYKPNLFDVSDFPGFCRGFLELQGSLSAYYFRRRGQLLWRTRLRIHGAEEDLEFISRYLPADQKKIQHIFTQTGHTCALNYQSKSEIADILEYVDGFPQNASVWEKWWATFRSPPPHR